VRADPISTGHGLTFDLVPGVGNTVFTGGDDGVIRRWDVGTGELMAERSLEGDAIFPLALAPDQSVLYAQTGSGTIRALDPLSLEGIDEKFEVEREIIAAAVSPDGRALAISTYDPPTVAIIDLETGTSRSLDVTSDVFGLAFSREGALLIAGDNDGRVLRVDPASAALLGDPVLGHDGPVTNVEFSPDGSRFTSGSTDGTIGLWDSATGRPAGSIQPGPPNDEARATWAPDGHTLFVMYQDGAVYAFDTRPASWLDHACRTAGRQLSQTEWAELLPDRPYEPACG